MNGGFGDDVSVEAVAEVNGVDVVAGMSNELARGSFGSAVQN